MFDAQKFYEPSGRVVFAVNSKTHTYEEAERMARRAFKVGAVTYSKDYNYAYFGFGKDSNGEMQNQYWLTESVPKRGTPVYAFMRGSERG